MVLFSSSLVLASTKILLYPYASKPEGPIDPLVFRAAFAMVDSVSNITGSTNGGWSSINSDGSASLASGCFRLAHLWCFGMEGIHLYYSVDPRVS